MCTRNDLLQVDIFANISGGEHFRSTGCSKSKLLQFLIKLINYLSIFLNCAVFVVCFCWMVISNLINVLVLKLGRTQQLIVLAQLIFSLLGQRHSYLEYGLEKSEKSLNFTIAKFVTISMLHCLWLTFCPLGAAIPIYQIKQMHLSLI